MATAHRKTGPSVCTPAGFANLASRGRWTMAGAPHLKAINRALLDVAAGRIKRLLVEVPVRHGKSEFISRYFPAWYLGTFPDRRVILTGYGNEFASEWGAAARDVLRECGPRAFGVRVRPDVAAKDYWQLTPQMASGSAGGGSMRTCGTLGAISGKGANLLISDDQIKDQEQAESPTYRNATWRWWMADAYSRLEPDGSCIVVLSRRHPDDMVGRLLKLMEEGGEPWTVLRYPVIAGDGDPLGRAPGEALWPARYPLPVLEQIRRQYELSGQSYLWDALWMQDPTGDGSTREWPEHWFHSIQFDTWPADDRIRWRLMGLDTSKGVTGAKPGDYSAITMVAVDVDGIWWVDADLERRPSTRIEDDTVGRYLEFCLSPALAGYGLMVEGNGLGHVIAKNILAKLQQRGIAPQLWEHTNTTNKHARIRLLTPLLSQGKVRIKRTPGGNLLLAQLKSFPTGHDDAPDSLQLVQRLLLKLTTGK